MQVAAKIHSGHLTASELCELCIGRLKQIKELNAFITEVPELALKSASAADIRLKNG